MLSFFGNPSLIMLINVILIKGKTSSRLQGTLKLKADTVEQGL